MDLASSAVTAGPLDTRPRRWPPVGSRKTESAAAEQVRNNQAAAEQREIACRYVQHPGRGSERDYPPRSRKIGPVGHQAAHDAEGQMSVTTAPHARMSLTTEPTRWTGGKTQLFSTPHWRERASVHFASARGWKYWEQKRPASQQLSADAKRSKV